ncbi:MAG: hypothetical protein H0W40_07835 [Methylibium sp.]|uniref:hypothetical protein n=1 Tax=Methylibium sp. TaxID=2067992 RepID=UPI00185538C2|nr:hypothetical protein [Methylibium sp.]MBA3597272.1 hypothetical protein [Methylibium sp.]
MIRRSRQATSLPALCLAVAALFAASAQAGPKDRPFKATLKITESVGFTGAAPCFAIGLISGVGQATPMGKVRATSQDCINPLGMFDPNGPTAYQFASSTGPDGLVFTASNGDRVFAVYSGTLTPQPNGPHAVAGHFVITGGSGRFAGATGGGSLQGTEDISRVVVGEGEIALSGSIAY